MGTILMMPYFVFGCIDVLMCCWTLGIIKLSFHKPSRKEEEEEEEGSCNNSLTM
jgi:hypothetical protein